MAAAGHHEVPCPWALGTMAGSCWAPLDCLSCFFIVIPVIIYCLSYIPYGLALGYKMPGMLTDGNYYKLIWDNQVYMLTYHNGVNQTHPYSSRWYQWLL